MIQSIRVKNFKAINDSGRIQLDALNVFIGRNGSGKSSAIEFLELLGLAVEFDLTTAMAQFRRGRDMIHAWSPGSPQVASLVIDFDPGDVSAGDNVHYEIAISSSADGDTAEISFEELEIQKGELRVQIVVTDAGIRQFGVPPDWRREHVKRRRRNIVFEAERENQSANWSRVDDVITPAIKSVDKQLAPGAYALRTFLDRGIVLRLFPASVAAFSPRTSRSSSKKAIDSAGLQTAELLASLTEDERAAVVDKLQFITAGFSDLVSHSPQGPSDQRFFFVKEQVGDETIEIPAWVLSEGTRRLTSILAVALKTDPVPWLAVEEIENGFDPWTLRFVLEELVACSERGTQIFLTTHSPYLMNLLPREVVHFVSRHGGSSQFSRVGDQKSARLVLEALGVGDAYVGDLLGEAE